MKKLASILFSLLMIIAFVPIIAMADLSEMDYNHSVSAVQAHHYAYGANDENEFKHKLAIEMYNEYFANDDGGRGSYKGIFNNADALETALSVVKVAEGGVAEKGYYTYELAYPLEAGNDVKATGTADILEHDTDIVVECNGNTVVVAQPDPNEPRHDRIAGIKFNPEDRIDVYGNGTCQIGRLDVNSDKLAAWHITQEHSRFCDYESSITQLSFRLCVYDAKGDAIRVDAPESAAAWSFTNFGAGPLGTESDNPGDVDIFYGNTSFTLSDTSFGGKIVSSVELNDDGINPNAITIDGTTVTLNTKFYDIIPLKVNFTDQSAGYINVNLVGIRIDSFTVGDVHINEQVFKGYNVFHGSDRSTLYSDSLKADGTKDIVATFYYDTQQAPVNRVNLAVTITYQDGRSEQRIIPASDAITRAIFAKGNEPDNVLGVASQGTRVFYDDFVVWSGNDEEYQDVQSVEVMAIGDSTDDSFDGAKFGSGCGVRWDKPDYR